MPTILLKKSDTASAVPTTANLTNLAGGVEVAVNTADRRMFTMNSSSAVVELGNNPTSLNITTGNLAFTGTAQRITGDMSNATATSRLAFQSSTTNGNTIIQAIPNGTATQTNLLLYANTDLSNSAALNIFQNATESTIRGIALGTGAYTPMTFYTGGSERMRLDTSGNLGINTASAGFNSAGLPLIVGSGSGNTGMTIYSGNASAGSIHFGDTVTTGADSYRGFLNYNHSTNTMQLGTDATARINIDSSGNVGIGGTASAFAKVHALGTLPSSSNATQVFRASGEIPSGTTSTAEMFVSVPSTQAASFTLTHLRHYVAVQDTIGAGSTVTNQVGFRVSNTLTGATNNYGFYSDIPSGSNRWNFYAAGTARNYFAGGVEDSYGNLRAIPRTGSEKTSAYTLAITDVGQFVQVGTSGSVTVPNDTFATGDVVSVFNNTTGNISLNCPITTAYVGGTNTDRASVTLSTRGVATVLFINPSLCVINGNVS